MKNKFQEDPVSLLEFLGKEATTHTAYITPLVDDLLKDIKSKNVDTWILVKNNESSDVMGVLSLQKNQHLIGENLDLPEIYNKLGINQIEQKPLVVFLSIIVFKEYRGQNLAKRACASILEALRSKKEAVLVTWHTVASNISSAKTALSCGFEEVEGVTSKNEKLFVKFLDN